MSFDFAHQIIQAVVDAGLAFPTDLMGCTEQQVEEIETKFGLALPANYRIFLQVMGVRAGDFLVGTDFRYPVLLALREGAEALLKEVGGSFVLPRDALVFCMHQGYVFLYFQAKQGDDPPVYRYREREDLPQIIAGQFSDWLLTALKEEM